MWCKSGPIKTCLFPNGNYDSGIAQPVEGCYCAEGFLLNSDNKCVPQNQCGCALPSGSGVMAVINLKILSFISNVTNVGMF